MSKFVLVTGASSGIGAATVKLLTEKGLTVFAGVRKQSDSDRIKNDFANAVIPVILDVTLPETMERAREKVQSLAGQDGLLGLVNNAGIVVMGPLESLPIENIRHQFEVNVLGQIAVTQNFIGLLRKSNDGRVINISSLSGLIAFPMVGPYAGSKFALEAISDSLRNELRKTGIQVVLIEPGVVATPIWQKTNAPPIADYCGDLPSFHQERYSQLMADILAMQNRSRPSSADDVARVILKSLTLPKPRPRYRVGMDARLVRMIKHFPTRTCDWLIRHLIRQSARKNRLKKNT